MLAESLGSLGLVDLAGSAGLFVNFGWELLRDPLLLDLLPAEMIVIEVLETVNPSPQVCGAIAALRKRGFRIALDDF